jgi:hypothetical protein
MVCHKSCFSHLDGNQAVQKLQTAKKAEEGSLAGPLTKLSAFSVIVLSSSSCTMCQDINGFVFAQLLSAMIADWGKTNPLLL